MSTATFPATMQALRARLIRMNRVFVLDYWAKCEDCGLRIGECGTGDPEAWADPEAGGLVQTIGSPDIPGRKPSCGLTCGPCRLKLEARVWEARE